MSQDPRQSDSRQYGLKQVYPDPQNEDATKQTEVDIIVLHGLDAESPKTWIAWKVDNDPRSGNVNWLSDDHMLPNALSKARILTYDWNGNFDSKASQDIFVGHADTLLERIHGNRERDGTSHNPVIIIASCFSGLLVARALVRAAVPYHPLRENNDRLLSSLIGLVFLGTPFGGWWKPGRDSAKLRVEYAKTIAHEAGLVYSNVLLQYMAKGDSETPGPLDELMQEFTQMLAHTGFKIPTVCFYENAPTSHKSTFQKLPKEVSEGHYEENAEGILKTVTRDSACLPGHLAVGLDVRHNMLHKFNDPSNDGFKRLCDNLRRFVKDAEMTISSRRRSTESVLKSEAKKLGFPNMDRRMMELGQKKKAGGTCEWLFETSEFASWMAQDLSAKRYPLLILEGKAGSGKSMVMHRLVEHAQIQDAERKDIQLSYFFDAKHGTLMQNSSQGLYRSLLAQLLEKSPPFPRTFDLVHQWSQSKDALDDPVILKDRLLSLLSFLDRKTVCIYIDALDECDGQSVGDIFDFLNDLNGNEGEDVPRAKLRVCLSTRRKADFGAAFSPTHVIKVDGKNQHDIISYLEENLPQMEDSGFRTELIRILFTRSSNMFQWVYLVVTRIRTGWHKGYKPEEIMKEVETLPPELWSLYKSLLEKLDMPRRKEAVALLQLVQVAVRPLKIDEVRSALEYALDADDESDRSNDTSSSLSESRLLALCPGLIETQVRRFIKPTDLSVLVWPEPEPEYVEETFIHFTHSSVRDFLKDTEWEEINASDKMNANLRKQLDMAKLCMEVVDIRDEAASFLGYATQFWTLHAREGDNAIDETFEPPDFVTKCSLMESGSIVDQFVNSVRKNSKVNKSVNPQDIPNIRFLGRGENIFVLLAYEGCVRLLRRHVQECSHRDQCCENPAVVKQALCLAAQRGFTGIIKVIQDLLAQQSVHIDINKIDHAMSKTPLYTACLFGQADVVPLLLAMGCEIIDKTNEQPCHPLHIAVDFGDSKIVKLLVEHARKHGRVENMLTCEDQHGHTVIHRAADSQRWSVIKQLLDHLNSRDEIGRVVGKKSKRGLSAYDLAIAEDSRGIFKRGKLEKRVKDSVIRTLKGGSHP